jgi:hypothetical protein
MQWSDIRAAYPDQWLIIEAIEASTTVDQQRHLSRLAVVERCTDGSNAFARYRQLHRQFPERELYFVHTSRLVLNIVERQWLGIRRLHESVVEG